MSAKIEKRNFTPKESGDEKVTKINTLNSHKCSVCGLDAFNATTIESDGSKYLVRVCNDKSCKLSVKFDKSVKNHGIKSQSNTSTKSKSEFQ